MNVRFAGLHWDQELSSLGLIFAKQAHFELLLLITNLSDTSLRSFILLLRGTATLTHGDSHRCCFIRRLQFKQRWTPRRGLLCRANIIAVLWRVQILFWSLLLGIFSDPGRGCLAAVFTRLNPTLIELIHTPRNACSLLFRHLLALQH